MCVRKFLLFFFYMLHSCLYIFHIITEYWEGRLSLTILVQIQNYSLPFMPTLLRHEVVVNIWHIYLAVFPHLTWCSFHAFSKCQPLSQPVRFNDSVTNLFDSQEGGQQKWAWSRWEGSDSHINLSDFYRQTCFSSKEMQRKHVLLSLSEPCRRNQSWLWIKFSGNVFSKKHCILNCWSPGMFWDAGKVLLGKNKRKIS